MGAKVDLSGKRFGRLTVLHEEEPHYTKGGSKKRMWLCKCDCGKTKIVNGNSLTCGRTKSCGCLLVDNGRAKSKGDRHRDRLYILWIGMRQRCNNKNHKSYKWYGGKGIKVCDEWDNDYESFKKWAYDNGYDKTLPRGVQTIDRINSDLDYSPDNCRWATQKEQVRNSSQYTKMVEYKGNQYHLSELCEKLGVDFNKTKARIYRGKSFEEAIEIPFDTRPLNRYFVTDTDGIEKSLYQFSKDNNIPYYLVKSWNKKGKDIVEETKKYLSGKE